MSAIESPDCAPTSNGLKGMSSSELFRQRRLQLSVIQPYAEGLQLDVLLSAFALGVRCGLHFGEQSPPANSAND